MKFVVLLREPAERCFSSWNMYRLFNAQNPQVIYDQYVQHANPASRGAIGELLFAKTFPAFATAVEEDMNRFLEASVMPEPSFVRRGLYYEQVLRYLKYFDLASFLFLETNELSSPPCVLGKIGKFLNLDIDPASMSAKKSNPGVYDGVPPDAEEILRRLKIFYAPHNEKLFKLIGQRYPWNES